MRLKSAWVGGQGQVAQNVTQWHIDYCGFSEFNLEKCILMLRICLTLVGKCLGVWNIYAYVLISPII